MITRNFDLMLFKNGTAPCINVSQYDQGETWVFTLYGQGGVKYTPTTGAIVALKSDGHLIANAGTVDGQGRVVITETQQMTASAGKAVCELQIDGDTHGTANFYLLVEPSPADGGIASDSDLSLFQEAIDAVSTLYDSIYDLLITESANGNPAVFADGAKNVPVKDLQASIVPVQNLNGYSFPWVGGANKNQLPAPTDSSTVSKGLTFSNVGGEYSISGTKNESGSAFVAFDLGATVTTTSGMILALNNPTTNANVQIAFYNDNSQVAYWSLHTVMRESTLNNIYTFNKIVITVTSSVGSGTAVSCTLAPVLVASGESDTTYSPYANICPITGHTDVTVTRTDENLDNAQTITKSLGTTVYGGTLDVTTGVLTTTHKVITLDGSEAWSAGSAGQGFYTAVNDMKKTLDYSDAIICDKLPAFVNNTVNAYTSVENGITGFNDTNNTYPTSNWMYAKGGGATTSAGFKTWLSSNNLQVCYELATPTTTQLTAEEITTLLGNNIISASSGSVAVVYRADTKMYVDNAIASVI